MVPAIRGSRCYPRSEDTIRSVPRNIHMNRDLLIDGMKPKLSVAVVYIRCCAKITNVLYAYAITAL